MLMNDTDNDHGNASCPRCGARFACMAGTGRPCHCAEVTLSDAQRAAIASRWEGCLCHRCLLAMQAVPRDGEGLTP